MCCPVEISPADYDAIRREEAVLIREFERADGSRFAELMDWGSYEEMQAEAKLPALLIVFNGIQAIGQFAVKVEDLIKP